MLHVIHNCYQHRRYIWDNAWLDLRYRYAGTGIGVFWNVLHPVVEIAVYTVVFSLLFANRAHGFPYRLYVTTGILLWSAFTATLQRGSNAFFEYARYLEHLDIPLEVFVAKIAVTLLFLLAIYQGILLPLSLLSGQSMGWEFCLLPLGLLLFAGLAFGMVLILASLQVLFPDLKEILTAWMTLWRWTMPIIYPETVFPAAVRPWLYLNPPYAFLRVSRNILLSQGGPSASEWLIMLAWVSVLVACGSRVYQTLQADIKDAL